MSSTDTVMTSDGLPRKISSYLAVSENRLEAAAGSQEVRGQQFGWLPLRGSSQRDSDSPRGSRVAAQAPAASSLNTRDPPRAHAAQTLRGAGRGWHRGAARGAPVSKGPALKHSAQGAATWG